MSSATSVRPERSVLQPLRVSVNTSASVLGNLVYSLCQAGLLIVLARLGSSGMVGQYALGLAITAPIMLLASLQLRAVQATDAAQHNHFSEYLALRLSTSTAALVSSALIAAIVSKNAGGALIIVLVAAMKNTEALSDVYRGRMQQAERMERVAISMVLRGVGSLLPFAVALLLGFNLAVALAIAVGASLLVWLLWDVRTVRTLAKGDGSWFGVAPRFDARRLAGLARTALPLGFVAMLLSLNAYAPQYALKHVRGDADLGIFAVLLYVAMATRVLIGAAGESASPRLARLYDTGQAQEFRLLHRQLLLFGAAVGVTATSAAALAGGPFLSVIFGAEYAAQAHLLVELTVVTFVTHIVSLQGYTVTATRCFRAQFPVSLVVAATTVAAAWLLVPEYGARGAAAAILAGTLAQGAGYTLLLRRALKRLGHRRTEVLHASA